MFFSKIQKTTSAILKANAHIRNFYFSPILTDHRSEPNIKKRIPMIWLNRSSISPVIYFDNDRTFWERIIHTFKHYWQGFKLLHIETKITFRLLHQIFHGHKLTRKERKQFNRTMIDLCRLVPFAVFIIVPFMEFTLPFFLKLFPNMLPSTFRKKENFNKQSIIRLNARQFLQDTLQEILIESQEQSEFLHKLRSPAIQPSIEELVQFSSSIKTRFILNKLSHSQLIALCQLLNMSIRGPNSYLQWKLQLKFHRLKIDDQAILNEGIKNLTSEDLKFACYERGINSSNIQIEQLQQWLDLHLKKHIPLIVLLLSRSVYLSKEINKSPRIVEKD